MGDKSLILKLSLLFFLIVNAQAVTVLISKEAINYEEKLTVKKLRIINVPNIKKACQPLSFNQIKTNEYITTHYINKNSIICKKDVKVYQDNSIIFNFGNFQIEKKGKIIFENAQFIRIKKEDGTIEKIYKDGRLKWICSLF